MFGRTQEEVNESIANIATLNIGDQVNVAITSMDDMGFMVSLTDYNNAEGFILCTKPKKKKINSNHTAVVVRIDHSHGFVDLEFV